jgi:hypothetical protein
VTQASGNLILGIYDASGPNGGPGALKAQTNSFTPVVGWNTENVARVSLPAGTYWLSYLPSSSNLAFMKGLTSGVSNRYYSYAFGALPATFSTSPSSDPSHWSFYATLNSGAVSQSISSVSLSNSSFVGGSPSGTVVGAINVAMLPSSPAFSSSLSLSTTQGGCTTANGANNSSFAISGSNLVTNGTVAPGTYAICILATEAGATNSPFGQAATITASSQSIASISLSNSSFPANVSNATVGTISVTMSPPSPAFSGTLSLSSTQGGCNATNGANNSSFQIVGNTLETNGSVAAGSYAVCILATQASASNSPVGQAEALTGTAVSTTQEEEFVSFNGSSSWLNPLTSGAGGCSSTVNNGSTNATTCLQNLINSLTPSGTPVLFIPAGTYRLDTGLTLTGNQSTGVGDTISIVCESPSNTTLKWNGAAGGDMLTLNGVLMSKVDRCTFDGNSTAQSAINQAWDNVTGFFDTGNEFADNVFKNAQYGHLCGRLQFGCAESSLLRDQFLNLTVAGAYAANYNASDEWIWWGFFSGNCMGATNFIQSNECAAHTNFQQGNSGGQFGIANSVFLNSSLFDIRQLQVSFYNMLFNYSSGSNRFFGAENAGNTVSDIFVGNTIINTTQSNSIYDFNLGPLLAVNNNIVSRTNAVPVIDLHFSPTNQNSALSYGNKFTTTGATTNCSGTSVVQTMTDCHEYSDSIVSAGSIDQTQPTLPPVPPLTARHIFKVGTCNSEANCTSEASVAAAVTAAGTFEASNPASKPVVYVPRGSYNISTTISVPACPAAPANNGCDLQIIGESSTSGGGGSRLLAAGGLSGPIIRLNGPSKATIRDVFCDGNGKTNDCVDITNADQVGSRVFLEQANFSYNNGTNLFSDSLNNTIIEMHDCQQEQNTTTGINVVGGAAQATGQVNIFNCVETGVRSGYVVSGSAHLLVNGVWYDNNQTGANLLIAGASGNGVLTYSGGIGYLNTIGTRVCDTNLTNSTFNNYQGTAALLGIGFGQQANAQSDATNLVLSGNGSNAQILANGITGCFVVGPPSGTGTSNGYWQDNTSGSADSSALLGSFDWNYNAAPVGNSSPVQVPEVCKTISCPPSAAFVGNTLNQLGTTKPSYRTATPDGVTDVGIYRVNFRNDLNGLHVMH